MKFRLTYEGPLRSINRDARPDAPDYMAAHKHAIRRHFHVQLRQLWATDPFLRITDGIEHNFAEMAGITAPGQWRHGASATLLEIATYPKDQFGFHFTPLVHEQFHLACSLDILFLRQDIPGSILHAGDIDNRVKTVIDALRAPRLQNEFLGRNNAQIAPLEGEDPFFVLLEDDKQVFAPNTFLAVILVASRIRWLRILPPRSTRLITFCLLRIPPQALRPRVPSAVPM